MKKQKEALKMIADDFVDGTRFGYEEGVNVEVPGQLFYSLMRLVGNYANEEVKWMYKINPNSLAETAKEDNVVNVISNDGVLLFNILGDLETLHLQNIKAGKTSPIEEIQEKIQAKINDVLKQSKEETVVEHKKNNKKK